MPDAIYPWMHLIGRILFSMLFIMGGLNHFMKRADMTAYAASRGAPMPPVTVVLTGVLAVAGGIMVMLGWRRFIGAGLLVLFLFLTAIFMHNFWKDTDPMVRQNEMTQFMKNMALAGAALFIAYYGASDWPMAVGAP